MKFCHISGYAASSLLSIGYFKLLFRLTLPLLFLHLFKCCVLKNVLPFLRPSCLVWLSLRLGLADSSPVEGMNVARPVKLQLPGEGPHHTDRHQLNNREGSQSF